MGQIRQGLKKFWSLVQRQGETAEGIYLLSEHLLLRVGPLPLTREVCVVRKFTKRRISVSVRKQASFLSGKGRNKLSA